MTTRAPLAGIDLNLLRALDALLGAGSVARAAGALGITPAAASNALRRLRDHFGDPLLVRRGAQLVPTPLAGRLAPLAAAAMRAAEAALAPPAPFDPARAEGELRVATSDHVDAVVLEPFRRVLAAEAPGVRLRVEPFSSHAPALALDGPLDLVIAPRARLAAALRARLLFEEPFVAVLRAGHPAARGRLTERRFAALEHLVVAPTGEPGQTAVDRALLEHGLERRVVRFVPGFASALLLIATSDLVSVVPRSFAALHARRLRLRLAVPPLGLPPLRLEAAWSPRLHDDALHGWARGRLAAVARSAVERLRS